MMKAQMDPSASLTFECDFEEPPEKVWRALTEPRLLEAWLPPNDPPRTDYEVMTAEPNRLLCYRWRERESAVGGSSDREVHSIVTVELAPGPTGGTHLRLTHGDFRVLSAAPAVATARVRPITSARRRRIPTPTLSFAVQPPLRKAA